MEDNKVSVCKGKADGRWMSVVQFHVIFMIKFCSVMEQNF